MQKFRSLYISYCQTDVPSQEAPSRDRKEHAELDEDIDFSAVYVKRKTYVNDYEKQLDEYLEAPRANGKTNILNWWKENADLYPALSKMARDVLSVPATSVPVERVFSEGASVVTKKRCSLSDENIRMNICINSWMKSALKNKICDVLI